MAGYRARVPSDLMTDEETEAARAALANSMREVTRVILILLLFLSLL
jgi:hypothetical protein